MATLDGAYCSSEEFTDEEREEIARGEHKWWRIDDHGRVVYTATGSAANAKLEPTKEQLRRLAENVDYLLREDVYRSDRNVAAKRKGRKCLRALVDATGFSTNRLKRIHEKWKAGAYD